MVTMTQPVNRVIRWGIWGTGGIAHLVASDFRLVKGAVLQAVGSRSIGRARQFASQHGVQKSYEGLEALLNDAEIEVVYVATPNYRHLDDSLSCIQAGKAVLCEKAFALNLNQARQIVEAARQRGGFCMEAMWTRFIPAVIEAKRLIDAGSIGSVRLIQGNFAYSVPAGPDSRFFAKPGGGALLDRGVYLISLAQHLLGVPQSIRGTSSTGETGVDEQSAYQLGFAGGALADLSASLRVRGTNEVVILGERGMLRLCEPFYCTHRLVYRSDAFPRAMTQDGSSSSQGMSRFIRAVKEASATKYTRRRLSPLVDALRRGKVLGFPFPGNGYQFELREVSHCLREHRTESTIMPLDDSIEVMRTMDAIRDQMLPVIPPDTSNVTLTRS